MIVPFRSFLLAPQRSAARLPDLHTIGAADNWWERQLSLVTLVHPVNAAPQQCLTTRLLDGLLYSARSADGRGCTATRLFQGAFNGTAWGTPFIAVRIVAGAQLGGRLSARLNEVWLLRLLAIALLLVGLRLLASPIFHL